MIQADTVAVVLATFLGPVAAIGVSLWREASIKKREQRSDVFRTLMATRRLGLSPEHVKALNLVEIDFYRCTAVQMAWRDYKDHLFKPDVVENEEWRKTKERLLSKLLSEIGKVLRYKIDAMDIYDKGYAPKGWAHREERQLEAIKYLHSLATGTGSIPIFISGANLPKPEDRPKPVEASNGINANPGPPTAAH